MSPTHEHLLGYLLGALEPWEHEQLEREIAADPELAAQVRQIAARIAPLEHGRCCEAPPPGLADRTCEFVFDAECVPEHEKVSLRNSAMSADAALSGSHSSWSFADGIVAAGIFIAAGLLFFPAIANSRYQAHVAQCQNGLRQYGFALAQREARRPGEDINNILTLTGNRAVAGIQPVMLRHEGYLQNERALLCPSSPEAEHASGWTLPLLEQIDNAKGAALAMLQRQAAGSFAFSLGYRAPDKTECDSEHSAVASDAPTGMFPYMVSTHHDGKGQNVLFRSGRTAYICGCGTEECGDSLFWNRKFKIEPGLDIRDIVLARGGTRPVSMWEEDE